MAVPVPAEADPILRALDVLRSRSGFLIMREAFYGTRRFDDFAGRLGMSPSSVAARLRGLVADGLLARVAYREAGARTRDEYVLTAKGEALLPALVALLRWANDHLPAGEHHLDLVHVRCDTPVQTQLRCGLGHEVTLRELRAVSSVRPPVTRQ